MIVDILNEIRRSSGGSSSQDKDSSSKYWMGKDYVNWIFKDLDTAKRPFNGRYRCLLVNGMPVHTIFQLPLDGWKSLNIKGLSISRFHAIKLSSAMHICVHIHIYVKTLI